MEMSLSASCQWPIQISNGTFHFRCILYCKRTTCFTLLGLIETKSYIELIYYLQKYKSIHPHGGVVNTFAGSTQHRANGVYTWSDIKKIWTTIQFDEDDKKITTWNTISLRCWLVAMWWHNFATFDDIILQHLHLFVWLVHLGFWIHKGKKKLSLNDNYCGDDNKSSREDIQIAKPSDSKTWLWTVFTTSDEAPALISWLSLTAWCVKLSRINATGREAVFELWTTLFPLESWLYGRIELKIWSDQEMTNSNFSNVKKKVLFC